MEHYRIRTRVQKIEEKRHVVSVTKGDDGEFKKSEVNLGWFVTFEGSHESLGFGDTKPQLQVGQQVSIVIIPE